VSLPASRAASAGEGGEPAAQGVSAGEIAALKAEQSRLAAELAELRVLVQRMASELGIDMGAA
jgi:hypothetical protein